MPLHIPSLAKKLQYLYQQNPDVTTHELLARNLGVAPNNISVWINGNEMRAPELIPNRHVKTLTDLFHIPLEWLELESLDEFKARLRSTPAAKAGKWLRVLEQAISSDAIQLVRCGSRLERAHRLRGLVADDAELAEQFTLGERLFIRLRLDEDWGEYGEYNVINAVSLSVDMHKTTCLCPSALAPNPRMESGTLLIPQTAPEKSLKIAGPIGLQSVLILLLRQSLPDRTISALMNGQTTEALEQLAERVLSTPANSWRLLRKDYEVV